MMRCGWRLARGAKLPVKDRLVAEATPLRAFRS